MKNTIHLILATGLLAALAVPASAQQISWPTIGENTGSIVSIRTGVDAVSYYGLAYGHVIPNPWLPLVAGTEVNIPYGSWTPDDFSWNANLQAEAWRRGNFSLNVKPFLGIGRTDSKMAEIYNLSVGMGTGLGLQKQSWGIALTGRYDRYLSAHIFHGRLKDYYPEIKDGWYKVNSGLFRYGLTARYSYGAWNGFLSMGQVKGQDFKDNPAIPYYAEFELQRTFGKVRKK